MHLSHVGDNAVENTPRISNLMVSGSQLSEVLSCLGHNVVKQPKDWQVESVNIYEGDHRTNLCDLLA